MICLGFWLRPTVKNKMYIHMNEGVLFLFHFEQKIDNSLYHKVPVCILEYDIPAQEGHAVQFKYVMSRLKNDKKDPIKNHVLTEWNFIYRSGYFWPLYGNDGPGYGTTDEQTWTCPNTNWEYRYLRKNPCSTYIFLLLYRQVKTTIRAV